MGVTNNLCLITTTIDIDDGTNSVCIIVSSWRIIAVNLFSILTRNHVDVHRRTAVHSSTGTIATTESTAQVFT